MLKVVNSSNKYNSNVYIFIKYFLNCQNINLSYIYFNFRLIKYKIMGVVIKCAKNYHGKYKLFGIDSFKNNTIYNPYSSSHSAMQIVTF